LAKNRNLFFDQYKRIPSIAFEVSRLRNHTTHQREPANWRARRGIGSVLWVWCGEELLQRIFLGLGKPLGFLANRNEWHNQRLTSSRVVIIGRMSKESIGGAAA
jgi:hypothetical protein